MPATEPIPRGRMNSVPEEWRIPLRWMVVTAIAVPFLILLVAVSFRGWLPSSDQAIQVLQIGEVGTEHTPLLGAYSRWGFNHPGPIFYYWAAIPAAIAGNVGVLLSVVIVNGTASAVACLAAWRRGGLILLSGVGAVLVLLLRTVGADRLVDPWNPNIVLVSLFALAVTCWAVAERDVWFIPLAVLMGSFLVQAHIGTATVVAALGAAGIALSWRPRAALGPGIPRLLGEGWKQPALAAAAVALLAWLPPLIEQFRNDPGNISQLVQFARDPAEPPTGFGTAMRVATAHLRLLPGWLSGLDERASDLHPTASDWLSALGVLAALAVAGFLSARRGAHDAGRMATLAGVMFLAGVLTVSRISGVAHAYLLRPWWSIGAFCWLALLWSIWRLADGRRAEIEKGITLVGAAVLAVLATSLAAIALRVNVPLPEMSDALEELGPKVRSELASALPDDAPLVVRWADQRNLGAVGVGMFLHLDQHGYDVFVAPKQESAFDSWHVRPREEAVPTLWLVGSDDLLMGIAVPATAIELASYDPLTPAERARHDDLWVRIVAAARASPDTRPSVIDSPAGRERLQLAGADPAEIEELTRLRHGSSGYSAYLLEGPPG